MNKINWPNDTEFIDVYNQLKSAKKVGEHFNCSKTAVLNHCHQIGFDPNSVKEGKLSEEDKQFIIENYDKYTSTELAQKFNVSRGMITNLWYKNDLKGKERVTTVKDDLSGKKINSLSVLYPTAERNASGTIMYLCQCDCGNKALIASSNLRTGKAKSCGCLSKKALEKGRGSNFKDLTGQRIGRLTVIERIENKTVGSVKAVQWLCKCDCGRETKILASNLLTGNTQSCGFCKENSHGNIKVDNLLTQANIPFVREKRFDTCKDKACLPFDFYVDDRYLIEYDGKQHFQDDSLYSTNIKLHDSIKTQWCKDNNIPLIRIPYTHYDSLTLEDLLLETSPFVV